MRTESKVSNGRSNAFTLIIMAFLLCLTVAICNSIPESSSQVIDERAYGNPTKTYELHKSIIKILPIEQQYQIQLTNDSIYVLDGSYLIGVMPLNDSTELGRMLIYDNQ